jgi:enoyl-CoA hydratase
VARITLLRPDAKNCIDQSLAEELRDACRRIGQDDSFRLAIITGSGDYFSVGRAVMDGHASCVSDKLARFRVAESLAALTTPVIVAINGDAMGQGLELALAGDLRIAADEAQFALSGTGQPEFPWDGGTQRLPRIVGTAWALDMALAARLLDAAEALNIGLVNRVVPRDRLDEATRELAEKVLASAPVAARYAKEAVGKGMDITLEQGLRLEADLSVILQSTADRAEGIASFEERRAPKFNGT